MTAAPRNGESGRPPSSPGRAMLRDRTTSPASADRLPDAPDRAMPRRDFLRAAGACSGGVLLGGVPAGPTSPVGAAAPPALRSGPPAQPGSSAGRRTASQPLLDRVGVQLYTVRSLAAEDMAATLDAVASVGYDEVEFAGWFGHPPGTLRGWLDDAGLQAPAAHVGAEELAGPGLEASLDAASVLGLRWLVLPWIPPGQRTPDGYRAAAALLNDAGEAARSAGVRTAYHNHAFEFEPLDAPGGPTGYDILLERLDPAVVDMQIDFHWSAAGGADEAALFAAHPGRFALCHLKDRAADGQMADVGAGAIDWGSIFALSDQAGFRHYFVEHDQPADPLDSIRASYRYLKGR